MPLAPLLLLALPQSLPDLARLGDGRPFRFSSSAEDWRDSNVDFRAIRPGETLTLADAKGPGTIRRIWCTVLPSEPGYPRLLTLRAYWDGEKSPSVECPLGDFFGAGHGVDATVDSLPVRASADGRARSCVWPMPFRRSARITVTNDGREATWGFYYAVDGEYGKVVKDAPYFHAAYRQAFPVGGDRFEVADIRGRGHYVGTVLSVRPTVGGWWGEGDDFFYVDGEREPSLRGTGLEDYFGEAWGLRTVTGAYAGCALNEGFVGGRTTAYRWHVPDPVRFTKGLRVEFEAKGQLLGKEGSNEARPMDEYASAALWYQTEPHLPYPALPPGPDRLPFDYRRLVEAETLAFKGEATVVKANGLSGRAQVEWTPSAEGAELTFPLRVAQAGPNQVLVLVSTRWDGGHAQFLLDGEPLGGEVSFANGDYRMLQEVPLPMAKLKAGDHTLTLRCVGKGWFGIDGLLVQPARTR